MKRLVYLLIGCLALSCSSDDSMTSVPIPRVVAEFKPNLSELHIYSGNISDLRLSPYAFKYDLNTPLFSDYAAKERLIALPEGTQMIFDGEGLPVFPDNTVIAKTFYYNLDDRNPSLGRRIIETRILIKLNGEWSTGDYKWNEAQTDAVLDINGSTVPVSWIDSNGTNKSTDYVIPSNADCFTCHNTYDNLTPIGPKLRMLNFEIDGMNQVQDFINNGYLNGLATSDDVSSVANWEDMTQPLEARARAYFDINCAHCHIPGGFCDDQSTLNLDYGSSLEQSNIVEIKFSILARITDNVPGFSMPFIGTTLVHDEGVALLQAYLDTL